ncbi:FtsK/SpoIIIE domain-containing protein [Dactylosporangium sp. NPDC051541]|uniref:FtsK/SpoIIIE domain-containing protein n=1 Tax=Dactylosporangium sp. NPDC051541 TaxID=3363977 RepID=UPI0037B7BA68
MLEVPIGVAADKRPVALSLQHALVVGATGSGKSELLRAFVLRLAERYPPDEAVVLLVDHHGGATFRTFARLPHLAGLAVEMWAPGDVPRLATVLRDELIRRQTVGPKPELVVVIDEFTEVLTSDPEFVHTLIAIGRVGRSLGVHLVMAGQRFDAGRLRGLDTYLANRIVLRMFTAAESRLVLGTDDAFALPFEAGLGFLVRGAEAPVRFKAEYVPDLDARLGALVAGRVRERPLLYTSTNGGLNE